MEIIVVGGGTAGWAAALMMCKIRPEHKVTVIESSKIGIIGAGEGSTGVLTNLIQNEMWDLGCDEKDFIKECDATIKYGIKHKAWNNNKDYFYYGPIDGTATSNDASDIIFQYALAYVEQEDLHKATELGINIAKSKNSFLEYKGNHAYHFDAHKVGKYFQKVCGTAVKHIDTEVEDVILDSNSGFVTSLQLSNGQKIKGDFFIDASGFKRVIMNKLNAEWVSYKDHLPVNSALPFLLPYEEDEIVEPVTTAWAQNNGWCWQIPTLHRKGCGYVFSDDFVSVDQAHAELEQTIGRKVDPIKHIKFDSGKLKDQWIKNCMAIGLCGAFAEPLEATSIHTTVIQLKDFIFGCLGKDKDETCNNATIDAFNDRMGYLYDSMRDFLVAHYTCGRNDTEFWKYIDSGKTITPFVKAMHDVCKARVPNTTLFQRMEGGAGWPLWSYVLAGTGKLTPEIARNEINFNNDLFRAEVTYVSEVKKYFDMTNKLPTNNEVMEMYR